MRALAVVILTILFPVFSFSQKSVEKTINTQPGDEINFDFRRADVKFSTWNKNEISITGTALVNMGEYNDAFTIEAKREGSQWNISTFLKDEENIPEMMVISIDGVKTYFKADKKGEWKGWDNDMKNQKVDYVSYGIITEIKLEVKVPQNITMDIQSKFGDMDIENFEGKLKAKNTHGYVNVSFSKPPKNDISLKSIHDFVDVSVPGNAKLNIHLRSPFGDMLTDMDLKIMSPSEVKEERPRQKNKVDAKLNGGGPKWF